jgi:hypothetical protein
MSNSSTTPQIKRRNRIPVLCLLTLASLIALYVLSDVAYRIWLRHQLGHNAYEHTKYGFSSTELPLYALDRQAGYAYRPNLSLHFRLYDGNNHLVRENHLNTNNFGHLELEDDSIAKPASEFRIAVLGDSFSATPTSDVTWPTDLEEELAKDARLKTLTGKHTVKVVNFGLDGTGFVQWPEVYRYKAKAFDPDLVIVNFIWNDIFREFVYRNTIGFGNGDQAMITCSQLPAVIQNNECLNAFSFVINPAAGYGPIAARIKTNLYEKMVARLPWFSPYPELLAVLLDGRFGLHPRLRFPEGSMFYFNSADEAVETSQKALDDIASQNRAVLAVFHPTLEECLAKNPQDAVKQLLAKEKNVTIENMLDFLPLNSSQNEIKKWYNLPYDEHPSDYGAEVYARALAGRVVEYLSSQRTSSQQGPQ